MRVSRFAAALLAAVTVAAAGNQPGVEDRARAEKAIRAAFANLYALPQDTSAAKMGSWVLDTSATTPEGESTTRWTIVVTKLTDTGQDLKLLDEINRFNGTSPRQLEQSFIAMQRLEGKISKAEADSRLEVSIEINEPLNVAGVSDDARRGTPAVTGANFSLQVNGDWMRVDDRELEIDYERWSPATLLIGFGRFDPVEPRRVSPKDSAATFTARTRPGAESRAIAHLTVVAQGNDEMIDRLLSETNWKALVDLVN
jgi:hypothetical protein